VLVNSTWWGSANRPVFEATFHSVSTGGAAPPHSFYMVPVIASRGRDGVLGIAQPATAITPDPMSPNGSLNDNDNIYSYRLRQGARGDG
jgi:hypothetical protein